MTPLAPHLHAIDGAALRADRASRRRFAERYVRSAAHLFTWTFPASRLIVLAAVASPNWPVVTRALCHAVYRDLQTAKALPAYLVGRQQRIDELRRIFTAECWLYFRQRASVSAQTGMGAFLNGLAAE